MADERWAQVSGIYNDAVALAPVDRAAFLRKACGGDEALRAEIESLLGDDSRVNALLETKGSHTARIGQRIGGYEIRSLLGAGGMGEVYRARDRSSDARWRLRSWRSASGDPVYLRGSKRKRGSLGTQSPPHRRHLWRRRCGGVPASRWSSSRAHAARMLGEAPFESKGARSRGAVG